MWRVWNKLIKNFLENIKKIKIKNKWMFKLVVRFVDSLVKFVRPSNKELSNNHVP